MDDFNRNIDQVAELMNEFGLSEAELEGDGWKIVLRKNSSKQVMPAAQVAISDATPQELVPDLPVAAVVQSVSEGTPIASPMTGIFYNAPSPGSPPFVEEGDSVTAGQVVGLIEAMKVFNEITATTSGTVVRLAAESGSLVQPGDPLIYVK